MSAAPSPSSDPIAFRRLQESLERSAAVFAELCMGDAVAGDRVVAEAMRVQAADPGSSARALSMRFWRSMLATPDVRPGPLPALSPPLAGMARLSPGLRVLVLLRLLSRLDDTELAAVLARTPTACRRALARAEAMLGDVDWAAWDAALTARQHSVTPARLVNIASWRSMPATTLQRQATSAHAPGGRRIALLGVAGLTVIGLLATFAWPWGGLADDTPRIRTRPLAEEAPKSRYDAQTAIATHPDRALLEIPDTDAAIARETAFYAWYQAERLGTATYEPPPPTLEAPEGAASSTDTGSHDVP